VKFLVLILLSYLIGGLPTGVIVCRILKKTDPRQKGSGSTGATNVSRLLGTKWGAFVLVIDCLKGYLPVALLAPALVGGDGLELGRVLAGIAAVLGHVWTVFGAFRGGKGVGTSAGVMLALDATNLAICLGVWLIVFLIFQIVSLASLSAAWAYPVLAWILEQRSLELRIASIFLALFLCYTHRQNISRLLKGTELPPGRRGHQCA
jgi:glycerol-3-phosphate acyltransferase PlsY